MTHFRLPIANCRLTTRLVFMGWALFGIVLLATETFARVGGGQSYGGGGGSGGGGGGGALIYLVVRLLLWLTIEHPVIGIPVDIIVIALVIYWFAKPAKNSISIATSAVVSAPDAASTAVQQQNFQKAFNQLRRFDPNFSEIIFIDFCYALYGRAHEARGRGAKALDELSPYLSGAALNSLIQLNPPNLKSVDGIIVGAMQVVEVRGADTPIVWITTE